MRITDESKALAVQVNAQAQALLRTTNLVACTVTSSFTAEAVWHTAIAIDTGGRQYQGDGLTMSIAVEEAVQRAISDRATRPRMQVA
ncbi:MAG: hypothetical protein KC492_01200 [Myxococcales bacterium]|nr:hypothetical protein [Myxococcales bacterium]